MTDFPNFRPMQAEWTEAMNRAFEGYTGPLDAVRPGDFAEALRLLREYHLYMTPTPQDHAKTKELLARLSPPEDTP